MEIIKSISEMQRISTQFRKNNKKIALVPTMGFLHRGHLSLIETARKQADLVITSIFVNPTQFAPNEDFNKYPRNMEEDIKNCEKVGCDIIFFPDTLEIYPIGHSTTIIISNVTEKFEGVFRPSHFQGVATIVAKLFNICLPDISIFGQKDYQQTLLIKKLVSDLNFPIEIIINPTIREKSGLAMSSRNTYLSHEEKEKATIIFKSIEEVKSAIAQGETNRIVLNSHLHKTLRTVPEIKIDYASVALANNLDEPEIFLTGDKVVILIAVYLGKTRLIDNSLITIPKRLNEDNFVEGLK